MSRARFGRWSLNSLLLLPLGVYCWTESFTQLASVSLEHKKILFQKRRKLQDACLCLKNFLIFTQFIKTPIFCCLHVMRLYNIEIRAYLEVVKPSQFTLSVSNSLGDVHPQPRARQVSPSRGNLSLLDGSLGMSLNDTGKSSITFSNAMSLSMPYLTLPVRCDNGQI